MLSADEMDDFADDGDAPVPAEALVQVDDVAHPAGLSPVSFALPTGGISALVGPGLAPGRLARMIAAAAPLPRGRITIAGLPVALARAQGRVSRVAGAAPGSDLRRLLDRVTGQGPRNPAHAQRMIAQVEQALDGPAQLVVLDHPFAGLEGPARAQAAETVLRLLRGHGDKSLCLATGDPDLAARLGSRIIVLAGAPAGIVDQFDMPDPAGGRSADFIADLAYRIRQSLKDSAP